VNSTRKGWKEVIDSFCFNNGTESMDGDWLEEKKVVKEKGEGGEREGRG